MFTTDDIKAVGKMDLSQKRSVPLSNGELQGEWEEIENLRLISDGSYKYCKLTKGLTSQKSLPANTLLIKGVEARVGASIEKYVVAHMRNGNIAIYKISSGKIEYTVPGFSTTEPVQVHSSGNLIYFFGPSTAKYINLKNGNISDYLQLDSTPIKSYASQTVSDASSLLAVQEGDRALAFPPDISGYTKNEVYYYAYHKQTNEFHYSKTGSFFNSAILESQFTDNHYLTLTLKPSSIYAFDPSVSYSVDAPTIDSLSFSHVDSNGYYYLQVDEKIEIRLDFTGTEVSMPKVREVESYTLDGLGSVDFSRVNYATISEGDYEQLVSSVDNGYSEVVRLGNGTEAETQYNYVALDESIIGLADQYAYNTDTSTITGGVEVSKTVSIQYYNYRGSVGFSSNKKYYRQYIIIDELDDGSVCMPGKPITAEKTPDSETIGVKLDVDLPATNVSKRYLCASRYLTSRDKAFKPSSQEYENSPLFIIRDVDTSTTEVYDFSDNDSLIRPITELLPMSGGVPAIFGTGQVVPKSIATFDSTIAIAGYDIDRPTPNIYTDFNSSGNLYFNRTGATTSKTLTAYFEYTDGTYSEKATAAIYDSGNELIFHSLNSLISTIHVYVDDGTLEYKVGSYRPTDAEFGGLPLEVSTNFSALEQKAIPGNSNVLAQVNLGNYVTIPIPAQNIQISSQAKIFGNSPITGVVPLDYDNYRNPLRYRLQVFTSDNIQVGYITEVQQGSIISYNANFEITDESRRAKSKHGINRIGNAVFFQDNQGINVSQGGSIELVIDNKRFTTAKNELTDVVFNEPHDEIWFMFGKEEVLVLETNSGEIKRFKFSNCPIVSAGFFSNSLYLATGSDLCLAETGGDDLGNAITGTAISTYFGDSRVNTELREVWVYGHDCNVRLLVDNEPQRNRYANQFDGFNFNGEQTTGPLSAQINGTCFRPLTIGTRLRIGVEVTGGGQIEEIVTKYIATNSQM